MNPSVIVLDNFYDDPEKIREIAYSMDFTYKENAAYPGREAYIELAQWSEIRSTLKNYIPEDVNAPCPKKSGFLQGKFRLALLEDIVKRIDYVHEDVQKWSGIIYLSLPEDCQGGVAFYKHKKTGAYNLSQKWIEENFEKTLKESPDIFISELKAHFKNENNWECIGQIPMRYNRAVLLMGQCFHGSTGIFGDSIKNGRLTQHFEFYTNGDSK